MVTGHTCPVGAAVGLNHILQHGLHHACRLFRQHLFSLGLLIDLQQRHGHLAAVVGQNRVGLRQLHGSNRQAVAIGQRRSLGGAPGTVGWQLADPLTREADTGVLAQTDCLHGVVYGFATNIQRYFTHANVTGLKQNAAQIQHAAGRTRHVANGVTANAQCAGIHIYLIARLPAPGG